MQTIVAVSNFLRWGLRERRRGPEHPDRQEVRIVAGATRAGATYCALRLKAHDDDQSVVGGADLVPGLLELLKATLEDELDEGETKA